MDAIRKRMRQRIARSMSQNCSLRTDSQVERGLELSAAWGRKTFSSPEPHVPLAGEAKGTGGSGDENEQKGVPTFFFPAQAKLGSLRSPIFFYAPLYLCACSQAIKLTKLKLLQESIQFPAWVDLP